MHALLTVATFGLWGVSWLAVIIGNLKWPWRCKHCGWKDPDFSRTRKRSSTTDSAAANTGAPANS
jgi:hypothetical protein